jgi:large subunit ribosomal protein L15
MIQLHNLISLRSDKNGRRVGRGVGSGAGKTCGRGTKGMGARSGYKRRYGYEGGQFRLYMKLPERGFNNAQFRKAYDSINLEQIERVFKDGETVNMESLKKYGFIAGKTHGVKVLGQGTLTKKLKFEVNALSESARQKLQEAKLEVTIL